jgi:hypothetical protein
MEKHFNTAGPVNRPDMYKIDPLRRWNLPEIMDLIGKEKYFILHAPRQSGKTSCLLALREYLNQEGRYFAVYANFEIAQAARNDFVESNKMIIDEIECRLAALGVDKAIVSQLPILKQDSHNTLNKVLDHISVAIKKPVVLFIDEIDSLVGDTLVSILRQLRAGYDKRPSNFPSTIILCGLRDIKDYRIHTSGNEIITGGSAFNIKLKSLRLGDFTKDDVIELYSQHTAETGQKFEEDCFDLIMEYTDGQPWLVNALAYEVTHGMKENRDRNITITTDMLKEAKERLIIERQTHLDVLVDRLREDRVSRVILPMILGDSVQCNENDAQYCIDLGLIKRTKEGLQISNKIYKEVIPRELTQIRQLNITSLYKPDWINPDGSLSVQTLLTLFKHYWNENMGAWTEDIAGYQEAAPHLITYAFLQRVANGNGMIEREYALGRKRVDIMLKWKQPLTSPPSWRGAGVVEGAGGNISPLTEGGLRGQFSPLTEGGLRGEFIYQNVVIEIKTIDKKQKYDTLRDKALIQTAEYATICGEKQAYLLIFDRDSSQNWTADEPIEKASHDGIQIEIWKFIQAL